MTQMIHKRLIYIWGKLTGRQPSTIINYEELTNLFLWGGGEVSTTCFVAFHVFDKWFAQL